MGKAHALIIDDNARNAQVLKLMLGDQGVSSTQVTNPRKIEDALTGLKRIDVVFLDLEMPGINGYEVFQALSSDPRFANVPIVACTVHLNEMNTVYEQGFAGFIGKPLDDERFPDQLARILSGQPVWETL